MEATYLGGKMADAAEMSKTILKKDFCQKKNEKSNKIF